MMTSLRVLLLAVLVFLSGCDLPSRIEALEKETATLKSRLDRIQGFSVTDVTIPTNATDTVVFGNQSGHRATVTMTNIGPDAPGLGVMTRRIQRPSDRSVELPVVPRVSLPRDFERTEWLGLGATGARRQIVVPCGFEVVAKNATPASKISLLIRYDKTPCNPV